MPVWRQPHCQLQLDASRIVLDPFPLPLPLHQLRLEVTLIHFTSPMPSLASSLCAATLLFATLVSADTLGIEVTKAAYCTRKTQNGDKISVHYTGTLQSDGKQFDSSRGRGVPFRFTLGKSQVIAGWDQGLLGMCIGEARKLTIPPQLAYGSSGSGPIPPGSTLSE